MKELEMALVCFINEFHKKCLYKYEKYQITYALSGTDYERSTDKCRDSRSTI